MKIPEDSIETVCCWYKRGLSMRTIAKRFNSDHHQVSKILSAKGIETRKRKKEVSHTKYDKKTIGKYKNMKNHLRFDVPLEWLLQFEDFEKLKFLNNRVTTRDTRFKENVHWYKAYIERFYYDEKFNFLYKNYLRHNKDKYLKPSLDHILPKAKGGGNNLENLRFITYFENMCKRDIVLEVWEEMKSRINEYFL